MQKRRFIQCDVFTSVPTRGNVLAVVVDGDGLSDDQMQGFAAWTNLAETTFLQKPTVSGADYKVRIFTPGREMPFAGHPTLGSCAARLRTGGVAAAEGVVRQECQVGIVEIDMSSRMPAFVAPPTIIEPLPERDLHRLSNALELDPKRVINAVHLDNGPVWQVLELENAQDVLAIDSTKVSWPEFVGVSVLGAYPAGSRCDFEVRSLSPSSGMSEDPITGSLNAAIARWMHHKGRLKGNVTVSQGTKINREGRVFIRVSSTDPDRVLIGGDTQILIEGTVNL